MNARRRQRIGAAFAAAADYDRNARVQAWAARGLARRIAGLPLPPAPRLLEIGCGTGFLTDALAAQGIGGRWLITDLAPAMLERARARIAALPASVAPAERRFAPLDGERGAMPAEGPFDLVCASLAFQWFDDLDGAVRRLATWLAPGGWLAFTTLADGTFAEWRAAHAALGLAPGTPAYPGPAALAALLPGATVSVERIDEPHANARAFLGAVKAIGAGTPAPGHRPLGPGALRAVMRAFEAGGATARYAIATVLWQKPAA